MVTIEVATGENSKRFLVHKALLCRKIVYFDKMFNGSFKESMESKATFPEDDNEAWALIVDWVYRGVSSLETKSKMFFTALVPSMFKAMGLAEKYIIVELADQIMDTMVAGFLRHGYSPGSHWSSLAYAHTGHGSKLRLYIARTNAMRVCFKSHHNRYFKSITRIHTLATNDSEFASDILRSILDQSTPKGVAFCRPNLAPACDYHQHGIDVPCPNIN
jgi:hypothetical protein